MVNVLFHSSLELLLNINIFQIITYIIKYNIYRQKKLHKIVKGAKVESKSKSIKQKNHSSAIKILLQISFYLLKNYTFILV